jgi:chemotaxis protein CheX
VNTTYDSQIEEIVQSIFNSMLGMEVVRSAMEPDACEENVIGTIHITGPHSVSVVLGVPQGVATATAATMLQVPSEETTNDDQKDVVAELTNMVGGNLKSLLPGPLYLSLPTVVAGREMGLQVPGAELVEDVVLECVAGPLRVRLYSKTM